MLALTIKKKSKMPANMFVTFTEQLRSACMPQNNLIFVYSFFVSYGQIKITQV